MEFLAKSVEPEVAVTLDPGYRSFPAPQWDIFIAHAGADAPRARQLFQYLAVSCKPFLDAECIRPGDRWDIELATAQRSSRVTVILVSSSTTGAMYAREEASV